MKPSLFMFLFVLLLGVSTSAQQAGKSNPNGYITIGGGASFLYYKGDVGQEQATGFFTTFRPGYNFYLERRMGSMIGLSLNGMMGKLSGNERTTTSSLNFETNVMQFGLDLQFHFDNDKMMKRDNAVAPYLSVGGAYMLFDPYGDLQDADGNTYHYWSDGSIRDLPQSEENILASKRLVKDYDYETQLFDNSNTYNRNTITIPVQLGIKMKLARNLQAQLHTGYAITMSDHLDNYAANDNNDNYLFTGVSVSYNIGPCLHHADKEYYKDVDFGKLFNGDTDNDGVKDLNDQCHNTPEGVKVDGKGCPKDSDKDGVPDYLDKESETIKGMPVDEEGVGITDERFQMMKWRRDSVLMETKEHFWESPTEENLEQIGKELLKKRVLESGIDHKGDFPDKFRFADTNKNDLIESGEITGAIDSFFEGDLDITVEQLYGLIDFFFEQ